MARHGENIRKRADGRWEGRYIVYSEEKEKNIYRSIYGNSYEEVKRKLTTIKYAKEEEVQTFEGSAALEVHFNTMAWEWLKENTTKWKHSTSVKYETIYCKYLVDTIGHYQMMEITVELVRENIPNSLSDSIQKSIYCIINQILEFAAEHYFIRVPKLKKPASREKKKPVEVLTRREQTELLAYLNQETDLCKMAVLLCLYTGLRLGEVCALKWSDFDFENRIITINRTVQRIAVSNMASKTILLETAPKSESSKREIPVSTNLLQLLEPLKSNGDYVFGGSKSMEPRMLQYHFKKHLKESRLVNKNFHILRHTFATNCVEGGTDVKSLSEILGHSDVQITLNRYVHPTMDTKRKHLDELWRFYGQLLGQQD